MTGFDVFSSSTTTNVFALTSIKNYTMQKCYVCFVTVCIIIIIIHKTASEIMSEVGNCQPSEWPALKGRKNAVNPCSPEPTSLCGGPMYLEVTEAIVKCWLYSSFLYPIWQKTCGKRLQNPCSKCLYRPPSVFETLIFYQTWYHYKQHSIFYKSKHILCLCAMPPWNNGRLKWARVGARKQHDSTSELSSPSEPSQPEVSDSGQAAQEFCLKTTVSKLTCLPDIIKQFFHHNNSQFLKL